MARWPYHGVRYDWQAAGSGRSQRLHSHSGEVAVCESYFAEATMSCLTAALWREMGDPDRLWRGIQMGEKKMERKRAKSRVKTKGRGRAERRGKCQRISDSFQNSLRQNRDSGANHNCMAARGSTLTDRTVLR